ncbi:hypothetical protein B0J14DRAFT_453680, partial [Halenospora varia]
IGRVHGPKLGEKITKQRFTERVKVALDLDRPSNFTETAYSTLIVDEAFRNKIYLKGLLLQNHTQVECAKSGF